jgi:hypothetical protein
VLPSAVNHTPADRTACLLSSCQAFIKLVNYTHMMPTRYNLDGDLKVRSRSRSRSRSLSLSHPVPAHPCEPHQLIPLLTPPRPCAACRRRESRGAAQGFRTRERPWAWHSAGCRMDALDGHVLVVERRGGRDWGVGKV